MSRANHVAFPVPNDSIEAPHGLTIREAFAMAAMQGILSNPHWIGNELERTQDAVDHADALIAVLEKSK